MKQISENYKVEIAEDSILSPKKTISFCPKCKKKIDATIYESNGKIWITKECPECGKFEDVYWSDAEMYFKAFSWAHDGKGVENPKTRNTFGCPMDCGLCNHHFSHTVLGLIDLTNRCNLRCPICFANSAETGYVYEPSFEQVVEMMQNLRAQRPVPCPAIQFAGGEPTINPDFFKVIKKARELGFAQIQVATNGLKLADFDFCQKMREAGMHTVYLQFDGFKKETYLKARGRDLREIKYKVIENCRKVKPKPLAIVLVPTLLKGINDNEVGKIVKFGIENSDVIRGVNFQPVSFIGRIDEKELRERRYTLPDLIHDLEKQTDFLGIEDFYTVSSVVPISQFLSAVTGEPKPAFTVHPHCGIATVVFIKDGKVIPISRFIDIGELLLEIEKLAKKANSKLMQIFLKIRRKIRSKIGRENSKDIAREILFFMYYKKCVRKFIKPEIPHSIYDELERFAKSLLHEEGKTPLANLAWHSFLIGGMHFQDDYNYDVERVMRCAIHYATPDGRIIPFCAYNAGPTYRVEVERKFSAPLNEWKKI